MPAYVVPFRNSVIKADDVIDMRVRDEDVIEALDLAR
jgi:hypothetical protein